MSAVRKQNLFNTVYRKMLVSMDQAHGDNPESTKVEVLDRILDKGIVYNDIIEEELSSYEDSVFVLASVETFLKFSEATGSEVSLDIYAGTETYLKFSEAVGEPITRNRESFMPAITKIVDMSDQDSRLLDKGIVESGNYSLLNRLIIKLVPSMYDKEKTSYAEAIDRLLDKGIVFSISRIGITISSVETFLKLIEAVRSKDNETEDMNRANLPS
jgi:hypothetical protein